ncbi:hypothetical protein ACTFIY_004578 [Dictyostelium cf. discoideum]
MSPMDINPDTSDSPFHPMGAWNTLPDFKFEKVKYIPRDAIPYSTGGLVRVTIDAMPVKLFQMDLCVKISAIKTKNQINGVAETGTYWRTVRDCMYNMFEGYTIYNGNSDIETVDFDQRKWEHISHKDQSTHDGDDYMSKNSDDVTRQDYSANPQFMKLALHNFHTRATHNSIYLNKTANDYRYEFKLRPMNRWLETDSNSDVVITNMEIYLQGTLVHVPESEKLEIIAAIDAPKGIITPLLICEKLPRYVLRAGQLVFKMDLSFIKGNTAYFIFQLRNVADVDHVRSPKYERYLPFSKARLLYSSGKEVYPPFEDMSENYSEMKKYFTLPAPYPNEKGFSRYNFGGYCWSLEPQNQHNKSGSLPTSGLNNLILEVTMKAITTQDIYIDVFFMSSQFIQQQGSKIQRVFTI